MSIFPYKNKRAPESPLSTKILAHFKIKKQLGRSQNRPLPDAPSLAIPLLVECLLLLGLRFHPGEPGTDAGNVARTLVIGCLDPLHFRGSAGGLAAAMLCLQLGGVAGHTDAAQGRQKTPVADVDRPGLHQELDWFPASGTQRIGHGAALPCLLHRSVATRLRLAAFNYKLK